MDRPRGRSSPRAARFARQSDLQDDVGDFPTAAGEAERGFTITRSGRLMSARPTASICCSPPESVPPVRAAFLFSRNRSQNRSRCPVRSLPCRCGMYAPSMRFSDRGGRMRRPSGLTTEMPQLDDVRGFPELFRPGPAAVPGRRGEEWHFAPRILHVPEMEMTPLFPRAVRAGMSVISSGPVGCACWTPCTGHGCRRSGRGRFQAWTWTSPR